MFEPASFVALFARVPTMLSISFLYSLIFLALCDVSRAQEVHHFPRKDFGAKDNPHKDERLRIIHSYINKFDARPHLEGRRPSHINPSLHYHAVMDYFPHESVSFKKIIVPRVPHLPHASFFFVHDETAISQGGSDPILKYLMAAENSNIDYLTAVLECSFKNLQGHGSEMVDCAIKHSKFQSQDPKFVVVDIGGNAGWFSLQSAALGYPVITFEPQQHCCNYIRAAAGASNLIAPIFLHQVHSNIWSQTFGAWWSFAYILLTLSYLSLLLLFQCVNPYSRFIQNNK